MIQGNVLAGWAHGDITPKGKTLVQGQFHARVSAEVRSPLTVTALALEVRDATGAGEQAVLLSCDLPAESFKGDLLRELAGRCQGLDLRKITIASTHTHNAPCQFSGWYEEPENDPEFIRPDDYRGWLAAQAANVIEKAWESRAIGGVSRGFGYAVVGRCRRATYADGSGRMYGATNCPEFNGFESCDDHAINFLFFHKPDGALSGIVINVACVSQCYEHGSFFSADFWHDVRQGIHERYGADVHLLTQCGAAGDRSPHLLSDVHEEADLRARLKVDAAGIIGRRILAALDEALNTASPIETQLVMAHEVAHWELPRMRVTREEYELEKRIPTMSEEELRRQHYAFQRLWPFGKVCELISRYENQDREPNHKAEVHVIRLGDVVIATNPYELFADFGARIRCRSKALQTFVVQLGDGSGDGFYLPTRKALAAGHYSAQIKSCWVGPEGGDILVDNTVSMINKLFDGCAYPRTR